MTGDDPEQPGQRRGSSPQCSVAGLDVGEAVDCSCSRGRRGLPKYPGRQVGTWTWSLTGHLVAALHVIYSEECAKAGDDSGRRVAESCHGVSHQYNIEVDGTRQ